MTSYDHKLVKSQLPRRGAPPKPISTRKPGRTLKHPERPLTVRQRLFLEHYLTHFNGTKAYLAAFPDASWATADSNAPLLLKDRRIASEIRRRVQAVTAKLRPTQERIIREMAAMAFSNPKELYDANGALIPIANLPDHVSVAIKRLKSRDLRGVDGDGKPQIVGHVHDVELHDKILPLRLLGAREGLFVEKVEVRVGADFATILREARNRAIEGKSSVLSE